MKTGNVTGVKSLKTRNTQSTTVPHLHLSDVTLRIFLKNIQQSDCCWIQSHRIYTKLHHCCRKSTMCWVNVETWACGSRNDVLLCRMLVVAVSDKYFLLRGLSDDLLFLCNFLIFGPILGHLVTWGNYPIFSINFIYSTFGSLFSEAFLFVLHYFSQILLYPFCTKFLCTYISSFHDILFEFSSMT